MSKIYTRTGDKGTTSLFGGRRVSKSSLRVEAYGTVDELNSAIGLAIAQTKNEKRKTKNNSLKLKSELEKIQHDLFQIGAFLATPKDTHVIKGQKIHATSPAYLKKRVAELEKLIDTLTKQLSLMTAFILPGGGKSGAALNFARTVCRRAERRIVDLANKEPVDEAIIIYMNRLSDVLFTIARFVNHKEKKEETKWSSFAKATGG